MLKRQLILIATICTFGLQPHIVFSGEFDAAIWVDRLIDQTNAIIDEGDIPRAYLRDHLTDTMRILGSYGKDADALRLEERTRFDPSDKPHDFDLTQLATGLSIGDFVDKAIAICERIESDTLRDFSLGLVIDEQLAHGNIETALAILPKFKDDGWVRSTRLNICRAYVEAGRIDDAKRFAGDPPDRELLAEVNEALSLIRPSIDDPDYVKSMVRIRRSRELDTWQVFTDYVRSYHAAEYAAHNNDEANFLKYATEAHQILKRFPDRIWERLDLAALYCRNHKPEQARELYTYVLNHCTNDEEIHPALSMDVMQSSLQKEPPAENIPRCFSPTELRDMVNKYIDNDANWDVAAALLALAIKDNNAQWAEEIYQNYPLPEFKAKVACYALYKE